MLTQYFEAAMSHATYEYLDEDDGYYGEIPLLNGVWATAQTLDACRIELRSVLEDWVLIGLRLGHEIPAVDGIELSLQTA